jgi:16S rRNA (adenine1518-N6/adenine1519-N6)-dimethyltransferase
MMRPDAANVLAGRGCNGDATQTSRLVRTGMAQRKRHKLGQHFLHDTRFRRRIVEAIDVRPDDLVIEIGPGRGALTGLVAERARKLIAVEVDRALVKHLQDRYNKDSRIEILPADILSLDLNVPCSQNDVKLCVVFGNLPYYITSPILHHLFRYADSIRAMSLLVQREVAERLTASPGSRDYGYLSVLAQIHAQPSIVLGVPPGAFTPPPKVHSALVDFRMAPKFPAWTSTERDEFLGFVKRCFAQKRKTLLNNLGGAFTRRRVERALAALSLPRIARGEELALEELAALHGQLQ